MEHSEKVFLPRTLFRAHAEKAARDGVCFEVTRISSFTTGQNLDSRNYRNATENKEMLNIIERVRSIGTIE